MTTFPSSKKEYLPNVLNHKISLTLNKVLDDCTYDRSLITEFESALTEDLIKETKKARRQKIERKTKPSH